MFGTSRRPWLLAGVGLVLVVLLLSHRFGRAEPIGNYRPALPQDALETGCYPLPGGATLDFAYQVRRDGDVEVDGEARRRLVGQYDEIDAPEALAAIVADFVEAGFVAADDPAPYDAVLREPTAPADVVRVTVSQLPDIEEDTVVRGTFVLDLPVAAPPPDAPPVCSAMDSTKRFTNWWDTP